MQETTTKQVNKLPVERSLKRSIKGEGGDGESVYFFFPFNNTAGALPPSLPDYTRYGFNRKRDIIQLKAPSHEGGWANACAIAAAQAAVTGWDIDTDKPRVRERVQNWLLNAGAGMGLFGYVPFITSGLRSYNAVGAQFIEIERETPANGSRVINIHHLNPLRCCLTGNPQRPVSYLGNDGKERPLYWHQVIIITDMLDPTEGDLAQFESATSRAYKSIVKLAAIENYIYEKVSGRRPLKMSFLGGATSRAINDAIQAANHEADRKGLMSYMGAAIVPVPGDVPLNLVEIPLAEIADITDIDRERNRIDLNYANALGIDPQDVNPALVGRQGLGSTGNQSAVLAEKANGKGMAKWKKELSHQLNELALSDNVMFSFSERDLRDEQQQAQNAKIRQETRKLMLETQMIDANQAKNLAVDDGDLPREFIQEDATGGGTLRDDEKPKEDEPKQTAVTPPEPEEDKKEGPKKDTGKNDETKNKEWVEVYY